MDIKKIKQIIKVFEDSALQKLEIEADDLKIEMEKPETKVTTVVSETVAPSNPFIAEEVKEEKEADNKDWVKSPLVGTFYVAPSPEAAPFVKVGDRVKEGDVLCIIEAMKVMNEIKAPKSGYVTEVKAQNGELVQFDQELIALGDKK